MTQVLHTLGYEKRSLAEFVKIAAESGIGVLVDVRQTAWSRKPGFAAKQLSAALNAAGIDYVHARFAGNPRRLRGQTGANAGVLDAYRQHLKENPEIHRQFELLVQEYLRKGKPVCISCFERNPAECHRSILAGLWRDREARRLVIHLPEGEFEKSPLLLL